MANDRPVSMKTREYRKVVKPLLERRRRARINGCLNELRNFILEATKQDSVQASKLEKADILEMTVHYLRLLIRQQCTTDSRQPNGTDLGRFRAGFNECANEVSMFVNNMSTVNPQVRGRLLTHLSKCLNQMEGVNTSVSAAISPRVPPTYGQQHPDVTMGSDQMSPPPPPPPPPSYPMSPHLNTYPVNISEEQRQYMVPQGERDDFHRECSRSPWQKPTSKQYEDLERPQSATLGSVATTSHGLFSKPLMRHPSKPVVNHSYTNVSSVANSAVVVTMMEANRQSDVWRPW